jgi:FixJ family two-component response regulator
MSEPNTVVLIVEEDRGVRSTLERLLRSAGYAVLSFGSASELLELAPRDVVACLLLDVRLPDASGLELQRELARRAPLLPIIFITGYADIRMAVRAMQNGAVAVLPKPFLDDELLDAVQQGLAAANAARREHDEFDVLRSRFGQLTARECDVCQLVVSGLLNKQIAAELGICEVTVKVHRGQVMHKTGAGSVAELVRMSVRLGMLAGKRARACSLPTPLQRAFGAGAA